MAVADIEELVKEGDQTHTCPFHTAQDLVAEGAGLVFLTYPQLFEPSVRSSGG
jgi:RNA polymerase subunit RPABC4/transcription elongation factor Spt4